MINKANLHELQLIPQKVESIYRTVTNSKLHDLYETE